MTDPRAILAARNNADWYAMMFELHGLRFDRSDSAFLALDCPPPYHSWMTTLDPEAQAAQRELITDNKHRPEFGVKDAFDRLDFADDRFTELFAATWFYGDSIRTADTGDWQRIGTEGDLLRWEQAWKAGGSPSDVRQFPAAILARDDVAIWGRGSGDSFDAGVIGNASRECVGLSNCFGRDAWPAAATLCAGFANGRPVVGYECADDLQALLALGFEAVGALRVWVRAD